MNFDIYTQQYKESVLNDKEFWAKKARELIHWDKDFTKTFNDKFENSRWFEDGELNACYNAIDRHYEKTPDKVAIIYSDNDDNHFKFTYKEVLEHVSRITKLLKDNGISKGDCVAIYMAMCPEAVFSVLACARLGIIHNVIFGGFSAHSLLLRISDSNSKFLITNSIVERGTSKISFLDNVKIVLKEIPLNVLIFDVPTKYTSATPSSSFVYNKENEYGFKSSFFYWSDMINNEVEITTPVPVGSEDVLFYLYTSGSTGKPKGMVHSTGGYLVYAALTSKMCFDYKDNDIFACTADIGWITGHTYSVYGPLLNGITTVIFGGTPVYPDNYRLFSMVDSLNITQIYTAPTVVRTLRKYFMTNKFEKSFNLKSLRLLGSVGEPINKDAYKWFTEVFNNLPIVDSYWQTETGGIVIAPFPYTIVGQPECASLPFFGIEPIIAKPGSNSNKIVEAGPYELGHVLFKRSWPGIARGVLNDEKRYKSSYFYYKGYYFTGDEGYKDKDGLFWIRGRADDVINVSGHRLSTAEVESAACSDVNVAEAAVVAIDDEITGQALCFFIVLKRLIPESDAKFSLKETLRNKIGKLVYPKKIVICSGLPKTATGKIMRRVLRDILEGKIPEDISTCINVDSIEAIKSLSYGNKGM